MNKETDDKFLELLDPLRDKLFMYALLLEKNHTDAEDLASDTILTMYEYFPKLKDESAFKAYLFKTARSKFRRKKRRSKFFGLFDDKQASNIISHEPPPDMPLDVKMLYEALDQLPGEQKEALVLFEISGFSIKEIAEMQKATVTAVKSRLKRGREKLASILTEDNDDKINSNAKNEVSQQGDK